MDDVLATLLECRWRDVSFPLTRIRLEFAHDLVEHKYWRVNAARLEGVGLAPVRIRAEIPYLNGIQPGPQESWNPQLYPGEMRRFVDAFRQPGTGLLQHPEFGEIACKAEHLSLELSADKRGGMTAEASWVETIDDEVAHRIVPSPAADVESIAVELDEDLADPRLLIPPSKELETSWLDLADKVIGALDTASLQAGRAAAPINRWKNRAERMQAAAERLRTPLTWPITANAEKAKSIANDAARAVAVANAEIGIIAVPGDTTLAGVQALVPRASIADLIRLNPLLVRQPIVRKGTAVRYRIAA